MYITRSELCLPCSTRTCKCAQFLPRSICNVHASATSIYFRDKALSLSPMYMSEVFPLLYM